MIKTTRAQRQALFRVFNRCGLDLNANRVLPQHQYYGLVTPMTYRQFRKRVHGGPGCIMLQWCGMWLGIEPDGYTHS